MLETPLLKALAGRVYTLVVAADVLLVGLVFYLVLSLPGMYQPAHGTGEIGALRFADDIAGRPQYAFTRLSGPSDSSQEAAQDLAEFAAEFAPIVRAVIEGVGSGA